MTKASDTTVTSDKIITWFMESVLEHETVPKSVYKFCNAHQIDENDFYQFFGSFEAVQSAIWEHFFENSLSLMKKSDGYAEMTNQDKMLTFFFTFFESLTLNRSYVLFMLQSHQKGMERLTQLKGLRKQLKEFASELIEEKNSAKQLKLLQQNPQIFSEGAWVQLLFLLKFWMEDSSPNFEKTDIAIEKSVTTIFQVFETTSLEKVIDFGKFLYKEKFA